MKGEGTKTVTTPFSHNRFFAFVVFVLLAWPTGAETSQDPVDLLSWVESASPDEYFQRDSVAGKYKFYQIFGYSGEIPAVGGISFSKCYSGIVELVPIKGTSDDLRSERHAKLNQMAGEFAAAYNRKMKQFIDSKGLSKCKSNVDWETAFNKLTEFVWGPDRRQGLVGLDVSSSDIPHLNIDIKDRDRAGDVPKTTCSLLAKYGITEKVEVTLNEWLPPPGYHTKPIGTLKCAKGEAIKQAAAITQEDAIRLAQEFIAVNGYTDLPRSKDKSRLSFELLDNFSGNLDQALASRQDTLERKAYGIVRERKSKSGWTIVFRYRNGNPENGRAVTMDLDGSNIRIEHKDFILSKVDKKLQ